MGVGHGGPDHVQFEISVQLESEIWTIPVSANGHGCAHCTFRTIVCQQVLEGAGGQEHDGRRWPGHTIDSLYSNKVRDN